MNSKEILNWLFLQGLYILSWILIVNSSKIINYFNIDWNTLAIHLIYISLSLLILNFYELIKIKSKYFNIIVMVLIFLLFFSLIPYIILIFLLFLIIRFSLASLPVILFLFLPALFVNLGMLLYYLFVGQESNDISPRFIFILLTSNLLFISLFYNHLKRWSLLPFKHIFKLLSKSKRMAIKSLQIHNVRGLIYLLFFIFLVTHSYITLDVSIDNSLLKSPNHDKAVLQSFICYIALDRILLHTKNNRIMPSKFLKEATNEFKTIFSIYEVYKKLLSELKKLFLSFYNKKK